MTLTLVRLAEIEAAAAQLGPHDRACDPATVAALCRVARAAVEMHGQFSVTHNLSDALRAAGLIK